MLRMPAFNYGEHTKALMAAALGASITELACATAANVERQVEVVYIPAEGPEKGQGVFQCRTKDKISKGALRLYPHAGMLLHDQDTKDRKQIERRASQMKPCYMRAVQVTGKVMKDARQQSESFLIYSAFMEKGPLVTTGPNDEIKLDHVSPYWFVMLASRDTTELVNMTAHVEEYKCMAPKATIFGELKFGSSMGVSLAFLTNEKDLAEGDLLVLPFDAGLPQICCESFPPPP